MLKELIKSLAIIAVSFSVFACGTAGSGENGECTPQELLDSIKSEISRADYAGAIALIDTLNSRFPNEIDVRKQTLLLQAKAMEGLIRDSIPMVEDHMTATQLEVDSLMKFFVAVRENGLPTYWVEKSVRNLSANSVQPRLQDESSPWVLVVKGPKASQIAGIRVNTENSSEQVLPEDMASRRVQGTSSEMATIQGSELQPVVDVLNGPEGQNASLSIVGANGDTRVKMTRALHDAILRTARVAQLKEENRRARLHRELLERKLIVAQNQIANFSK